MPEEAEGESRRQKQQSLQPCTHLKGVRALKCKEALRQRSKECRQCAAEKKGKQGRQGKKGKRRELSGELWLCLACGSFCCGEEDGDHAHEHCQATKGGGGDHCVFMEISDDSPVHCFMCNADLERTDETRSISVIRKAIPAKATSSVVKKSERGRNVKIENEIPPNCEEDEEGRALAATPIGLANLGNTCYFNAILQCLLVSQITFNAKSEKMRKYPLISEFHSLYTSISTMRTQVGASGVYNPGHLLHALGEIHPQFSERDQMDSHEALIKMIQTMEEEEDKHQLNEASSRQKLVTFPFVGEVESCVVCLKCGAKSYSKQSFVNMVIPCPEKSSPLLEDDTMGYTQEDIVLQKRWAELTHSQSPDDDDVANIGFTHNSLEYGLFKDFLPELIEGKNAYKCEKCFENEVDVIGDMISSMVLRVAKEHEGDISQENEESVRPKPTGTRRGARKAGSRSSMQRRRKAERRARRRGVKKAAQRKKRVAGSHLDEEDEHIATAMKRIRILRHPSVLVVHINRFRRKSASRFSKNDAKVEFPLVLDANFLEIKAKYFLSAVVLHSGSMDYGHYVAYVNMGSVDEMSKGHTGSWFLCNDSQVSSVGVDTVLQTKAYILFYTQMK